MQDNVAISGLAKLYIQYGEFKKAEDLYKNIVDTYPMAAYELDAHYQLGLLYFRGANGFIVDYKIAMNNFAAAADNGHAAAAYMIERIERENILSK